MDSISRNRGTFLCDFSRIHYTSESPVLYISYEKNSKVVYKLKFTFYFSPSSGIFISTIALMNM